MHHVPYLLPAVHKDYVNDVRFYDCWSKLTPFSLVEYERVVQLDSDMMVLQNMDELMDLELDPPEMAGTGNRVFAASHACVCNPLHKAHYPKNWYVRCFRRIPWMLNLTIQCHENKKGFRQIAHSHLNIKLPKRHKQRVLQLLPASASPMAASRL